MSRVIRCPLDGSARWARLLWKFPALKALSGLARFLCTYVFVFVPLKLLVYTWRHGGYVGGQEQKHFSPLGTKPYFHVNSSRKILLYWLSTWPACHVVAKTKNRPFRSCPKPLFQSEAKSEAIDMKAILYSHASKTHFHKKVFVLSLVLKGRVFGTRK